MRTVNRFSVLGNVGSIKDFGKVAKVSIATNRVWTDQQGERQQRTDWVELSVLDAKQAAWVIENVKPGDGAYAEGHIASGSYGEGDNRKFTTDLIVSVFNTFPTE